MLARPPPYVPTHSGAEPIFVQRHDAVGGQRGGIVGGRSIHLQRARGHIEPIEASRHRADPQHPLAVVKQRHDAIVGQPHAPAAQAAARTRVRARAEMPFASVAGVDLHQPCSNRAHPHLAGAVIGKEFTCVSRNASLR